MWSRRKWCLRNKERSSRKSTTMILKKTLLLRKTRTKQKSRVRQREKNRSLVNL